jgi:cell division septation protein DedD
MDSGRLIAGRYELEANLGGGGMGTVHRAHDTRLDRTVVVKLPRRTPELDTPQYRSRFETEAKAAARLEHDHVVRVYDYGDDAGQLYLVMELVRGETLAALIERRTSLTLGQKVALLSQLCGAMEAIHAAGIVHRDLKPLNLMVSEDASRLKVVDFGLAKLSAGSLASLFGGTPQYMSPEQFDADARIDNRTDLFSLGLVAYELLAYRRVASTRQGIPWQLSGEAPSPLLELENPARPALEALVFRCLERDPMRRFQRSRDVAEELERVPLGAASSPPVEPFGVTTEVTIIDSVRESTAGGRPVARRWTWLAAVVAVVAIALGSWSWQGWRNQVGGPSNEGAPSPPASKAAPVAGSVGREAVVPSAPSASTTERPADDETTRAKPGSNVRRPSPAGAPAVVRLPVAVADAKISLQVAAKSTRAEADVIARRLSAKGYPVYVVEPLGDGKVVYRVRVGNYATADEAKTVAEHLRIAEKLMPWIVR